MKIKVFVIIFAISVLISSCARLNNNIARNPDGNEEEVSSEVMVDQVKPTSDEGTANSTEPAIMVIVVLKKLM